jgi:hypothetical protein
MPFQRGYRRLMKHLFILFRDELDLFNHLYINTMLLNGNAYKILVGKTRSR